MKALRFTAALCVSLIALPLMMVAFGCLGMYSGFIAGLHIIGERFR